MSRWLATARLAFAVATTAGIASTMAASTTASTVVSVEVPSATNLDVITGCAPKTADLTDFGQLQPGTENVTAAAGVDALAKLVKAGVATEELEAKRVLLLDALSGAEPELRGDQERRLPNTLNVAFAGIDGEDLLLALDLEGVAASSGSACTAGSLEPSHVIKAMGFDERAARRSVRFSFGVSTSDDELRMAGGRVVAAVARLRAL